jgi:hypothetical protein
MKSMAFRDDSSFSWNVVNSGFDLTKLACGSFAAAFAGAETRTHGIPLLVDLSVGSGRAFQSAADLATQLGVDASPPETAAGPGLFRDGAFARAAAWGVDDEAAGDAAVARSYHLAVQMAAHLDALVLVLPPRFGASWDPADAAFLCLLEAIAGTGTVAIATDTDETVEAPDAIDEIVPLIPGVLSAPLTATLKCGTAGLIPLRGGAWAVPPRHRLPPHRVSTATWDWLALRAAHVDWLAAHAQLRSSPEMVRPNLLADDAENLYAAGHTDGALARVERLVECSTGDCRDLWLVRLQCMRIGRLRFAEAAAVDIPSARATMSGFLKLTRGWGCVMTGRLAEADALFAQARELLAPLRGRSEYLYVLNISALARARLGDVNGAERIELEIERELAQLRPRNWQLEYINAINLHRLYRLRGDTGQARRYLDRSLDANAGTRRHNDAVYAAHNLWRMAQMEGSAEDALIYGLHCVLLFLADHIPEALASRTAAGLLGKPWPLTEHWTVDGLCVELERRLCATLVGARIGIEAAAPAGFVLSGTVQPSAFASATAVFANGIGIIHLAGNNSGERNLGPAHRSLRALATSALGKLLGVELAAGTIVVDDRLGRGLPRIVSDLVGVAFRLGVAAVILDGRRLRGPDRARIEASAVVKIGPGVDRIEGDWLHFRRVLPAVRLTTTERSLLQKLAAADRLVDQLDGLDLNQLRSLERRLLLTIDIDLLPGETRPC